MADSIIERLPTELQTAIISFINRPSHLCNVCLTCKTWAEIATPYLYHIVKLDLEKENVAGQGILKDGHPGHKHIRTLKFVIASDMRILEMQDETKRSMNVTMRTLLQLLPDDILEEFSHPYQLKLHDDTIPALYTKQRRLKKLSLGRVSEDLDMVAIHPNNWLRFLHTLNLIQSPESTTESNLHRNIVRGCEKLRCLKGGTRAVLLHDRKWPRRGVKLEELEFQSLDLTYIQRKGRMVPRFFKLEHLKYLSVNGCTRLAWCLEFIMQEFRRSGISLRGFVCRDLVGSAMEYLHDFLGSFSTLEYLQISGRSKTSFDPRSLRGHSATLKHVYVQLGIVEPVEFPGGQWRADITSIQSYINNTPNLQQIALELLEMRVNVEDEDNLGLCGEFFDLLSQFADLRIVRIVSWPRSSDRKIRRGSERYLAELDIFANLLVKRLTRNYCTGKKPPLRVLCIGNRMFGPIPLQGKLVPAPYVISYTIGPDGSVQAAAQRQEFHLMEYEEPLFGDEDSGLFLEGVKSVA